MEEKMLDRRIARDRRKKERRRLLTEDEFRRLIETGKVFEGDRRSWQERRKGERRRDLGEFIKLD